jgi:hypothetical protein
MPPAGQTHLNRCKSFQINNSNFINEAYYGSFTTRNIHFIGFFAQNLDASVLMPPANWLTIEHIRTIFLWMKIFPLFVRNCGTSGAIQSGQPAFTVR